MFIRKNHTIRINLSPRYFFTLLPVIWIRKENNKIFKNLTYSNFEIRLLGTHQEEIGDQLKFYYIIFHIIRDNHPAKIILSLLYYGGFFQIKWLQNKKSEIYRNFVWGAFKIRPLDPQKEENRRYLFEFTWILYTIIETKYPLEYASFCGVRGCG